MATTTHTIDQRGDLWLLVTASETDEAAAAEFQVCSRTLARASPVLDTMLYGPFAEAKQSGAEKWRITLHGDNPGAIKSLLQIMHGQTHFFSVVSEWTKEAIQGLYNLIVAADKYQCICLLKTWAGVWIRSMRQSSISDIPRLLWASWIYYQLGFKDGYASVVIKLFATLPQDTMKTPKMVLPPELFPNLLEARLNRKQAVLDLVSKAIDNLTFQRSGRPKYCEMDLRDKKYDCEMALLGNIHSVLAKEGMFPVPKASEVTLTQAQLCKKVKEILLSTRRWGHKYCCAVARIDYESSREQVLDGILKAINCAYLPSATELEYVEAQADLLGIDPRTGQDKVPSDTVMAPVSA